MTEIFETLKDFTMLMWEFFCWIVRVCLGFAVIAGAVALLVAFPVHLIAGCALFAVFMRGRDR